MPSYSDRSDFVPALRYPIKFAVNPNRYDDDGQYPKSLSIFIPLECIHAFAQHLMNMADQADKHLTAKVWDYSQNAQVEVKGVYLNAKAKEGASDSVFGNINPRKIDVIGDEEQPF